MSSLKKLAKPASLPHAASEPNLPALAADDTTPDQLGISADDLAVKEEDNSGEHISSV